MTGFRFKSVIMAVLMALGLSIAISGPAFADGDVQPKTTWEKNYAVKTKMNDRGKWCKTAGGEFDGEIIGMCFQPEGDYIWLWDYKKDGHHVRAEWDIKTAGRAGVCIDNLGNSARWTRCNKDFPENMVVSIQMQWYEKGKWQHSDWYMFPVGS